MDFKYRSESEKIPTDIEKYKIANPVVDFNIKGEIL